jgi:uncharacterized membrane protein
MKNLTDEELFDLANEYLVDNSKHATASVVLFVVGIIQSLLLMFSFITIVPFLLVAPIVYGFGYYHMRKGNKSLDKVDEILKEFDSRVNN